MDDNINVDVSVASGDDNIPGEAQIAEWVSAAVKAVQGDVAAEVSLRIVDEEEGGELNARYRQKSGPTNVLSFPADDSSEGLPPELPRMLGDIVVCAPVVAREASSQGKEAEAHWAHLFVHGALHLLGYDHEEPADAEAMESVEKQILARYGIGDPYAV